MSNVLLWQNLGPEDTDMLRGLLDVPPLRMKRFQSNVFMRAINALPPRADGQRVDVLFIHLQYLYYHPWDEEHAVLVFCRFTYFLVRLVHHNTSLTHDVNISFCCCCISGVRQYDAQYKSAAPFHRYQWGHAASLEALLATRWVCSAFQTTYR